MPNREEPDRPAGEVDELDRELREPTAPELPLVEDPLGVGHPVDPHRPAADPLGLDEPSEGQLALEREARATRSAPRR